MAKTGPKGAHRRQPASYFRPVNDSVVSKTLPPSPCKGCGSSKHWDRECPHWEDYLAARSSNQALVEFDIHPSEEVDYAHTYLDSNKSPLSALSSCAREGGRQRQQVSMEEEAEEPSSLPSLPRDHPHVMQPADDDRNQEMHAHLEELAGRIDEALRRADECLREENVSTKEHAEAAQASTGPPEKPSVPQDAQTNDPAPQPSPASPIVIQMPRARKHPAGHSTIGISALSVPVHLGNQGTTATTARLDSGADISLISTECLAAMPAVVRPRVQRGLRMNLFQLTNGFKIDGFVRLPVLVQADDGDWLAFEGEFYVVPGMTSALLLGEDFQVTYELTVHRSVEEDSSIEVPATGHTFTASSSTTSARRPFGIVGRGASASFDCTIHPHSCRPIPVAADFGNTPHWFAEKTVLGQADGSCLLTTPTIIDAAHAYIAVTNPTDRPVRMQHGEVLCRLHDPDSYFQTP
ncbi:hypothetical protein FOMPIDRAFT_43375, partial [Fomitopsis schrenkii]